MTLAASTARPRWEQPLVERVPLGVVETAAVTAEQKRLAADWLERARQGLHLREPLQLRWFRGGPRSGLGYTSGSQPDVVNVNRELHGAVLVETLAHEAHHARDYLRFVRLGIELPPDGEQRALAFGRRLRRTYEQETHP